MDPPCPFEDAELSAVAEVLADPRPPHASSPLTVRAHAEHCMWQCVRFAHLASLGHPFRGPQWGMNFGRAQELLRAPGGLPAWWRAYEPLLDAQDWKALETLSRRYIHSFGLSQPPDEFTTRV